jgi:MYXO-CTERM domain-containing protein
MGFEDGSTDNTSWNNDGDFNDSLFLFEGLTCAGGGEPCEVAGTEGVCKAGLTECAGAGTLSCKQLVQPDAEACDGIDNDCNGAIDEGDGLCPPRELCVQGRCIPNCSLGEFPCRPGSVCSQGVCVDEACAARVCAEGQACIQGDCVAPCDGVVCPGQQQCIRGRCLDLCAGVTCDGGRVCAGGVCVESCDCRGCEGGSACQGSPHPAAGQCVPAACLDRPCPAGESCTATSNGACAPLCGSHVVCPRGQTCTGGECAPAPTPDGGTGAGGGSGTGGQIFIQAGGSTGGPVPAGGGAFSGGPDAGASSGGSGASSAEKLGCGCRVAAPTHGTTPRLLGFLLLGVFAAWRRRDARQR